METAVGSLAIAGATLAQVMNDFSAVEGDCDGLLFGRLQHHTTSNMQDDSVGPPITHEHITARVTGYYCSGRVQSFYDATGRLNQSTLSSIVRERQSRGEDPPIGWYLGRRNSSLWPSMREVAVTTYLRSGIDAPPLVEENAATVTSSSKLNIGQVGKLVGAEPSSTSHGGSRKSSSFSPIGNNTQTGRIRVLGEAAEVALKPLLPTLEIPSSAIMSSSPSRRSSNSASSPRQETRVEPTVENRTSISPCLFVLFTESDSINKSVRTHEYRAFQSLKNPRGISFEPLPVNIVNAGVLRGFYDSFVPVASIPSWFNSNLDLETNAGGSPAQLRSGGEKSISRKPDILLDYNGGNISTGVHEGELVSSAQESVDTKGGSRVIQFESMYQQMLTRLKKLSVEAYESSAALQ